MKTLGVVEVRNSLNDPGDSSWVPAVKVDFRSRVIPFRDREIAEQERAVWISRGYRARVIERNGVYNVVVSQ